MIQLSFKKYLFWLENASSFKKQLISKVESFLKPKFNLNRIDKIVLTQNHSFIMIGEMLSSYENAQKLKFEGDWAKLRLKIYLLRKSRTKYLEQVIETKYLKKSVYNKVFGTKYLEQSKEIR